MKTPGTKNLKRTVLAVSMLGALASGAAVVDAKEMSMGHHTLLLKSAAENAGLTEVTLPIFEGRRGEDVVWYVVTESSNAEDAKRRGVHYSPKMANAKGSEAVEKVTMKDGMIQFTGTVVFTPERVVQAGPTGFPPAKAEPGAIGEAGYTPMVELPDGTILNAPHIKNSTGTHDRLVSIDEKNRKVNFRMTNGFYEGKVVHYVSFNASDAGVAALEAVTYTPRLAGTPRFGSDASTSALTGLAPIANGPTGKMNKQRQGLSSALMGEGDPFNIVQEIPAGEHAALYTPMWDVHLGLWSGEAMKQGKTRSIMDFRQVARLADEGYITGPEGKAWGAVGIVVNCPIISIDN